MSDWNDAAFVLDLSFWAHKAWHAVARDTPAGHVPNMLAAFANMLVRLLAERQPRYLVAAAEVDGPTWRHELYPAYKVDRPPHPPGFDRQLVEAVRLLELHRIPVLGAGGFEADDVIATIVRALRASGIACVVITADKDLRQLVTDAEPAVVLWDGQARWVGERTVRDEWKIGPERVADLLALTGDDGDGVPGLRGVGPAKGAALLAESRDLEHAIALRQWGSSAAAKALREGVEQVRLARRLVELREAPVVVDVEAARVLPERWDREGLLTFYEAADLRRLAERLSE